MAFTDAQKVQIRKYCGYPVMGNSATQFFGYRYFTHYGQMEFHLNNLSSEEETEVVSQLSELNQLEQDLYGTSGVRDNIDTAKAAVWERNKAELTERKALYRSARLRLCQAVGTVPGPQLQRNMGAII